MSTTCAVRPARRARLLAVTLVATLAVGGLAACGSDDDTSSGTTTPGGIAVTDVWARSSAASATNGAVYLTITNDGSTADELTAVAVPATVAATAQIHETTEAMSDMSTADTMATSMEGDMSSGEGEGMGSTATTAAPMMTMKEVASVPVPAGGSVTFAPGGYHVMLLDLVAPLEVGSEVPVTLTFARAGEVTVTAEVRAS